MRKLSGEVAFLDADGNIEVKDFGADTISVKDDGRVLPVVHRKPELAEGEVAILDRYKLGEDCVEAIYRKETMPLAVRVEVLESQIAKIMIALGIDG